MHVTRGEAPSDARGERRDDREGRGEALRHALENGHPMHDAVVTAVRAQIHCARRAARMRRRLVSVSRTSGASALARPEREPGPSTRIAKRNINAANID